MKAATEWESLNAARPLQVQPLEPVVFTKLAARVAELLEAKAYSDRRDYARKHKILRRLVAERPDEFTIDSKAKGIIGLTHRTGFKIHVPSRVLPASFLEKSAVLLSLTELDAAAAQAEPEPTLPQREAGNYQLGHVQLHGLDISIETARDAYRAGVGADGKAWRTQMKGGHYGYIRGTRSEADGDHVDVLVGPNPESELVFVINQVDPETGRFDEHKTLLGYNNAAAAEQAYRSCYEKGWDGFGGLTALTLPQFKWWLEHGNTSKPIEGGAFAKKGADSVAEAAESKLVTASEACGYCGGGLAQKGDDGRCNGCFATWPTKAASTSGEQPAESQGRAGLAAGRRVEAADLRQRVVVGQAGPDSGDGQSTEGTNGGLGGDVREGDRKDDAGAGRGAGEAARDPLRRHEGLPASRGEGADGDPSHAGHGLPVAGVSDDREVAVVSDGHDDPLAGGGVQPAGLKPLLIAALVRAAQGAKVHGDAQQYRHRTGAVPHHRGGGAAGKGPDSGRVQGVYGPSPGPDAVAGGAPGSRRGDTASRGALHGCTASADEATLLRDDALRRDDRLGRGAVRSCGVKAAALRDDVAPLQPQQQRVAERVRDGGNLLVYHGLGSGKTRASLAAAETAGEPYAAVVPASLRPNYTKEIDKWTDQKTPHDVLSYNAAARGVEPKVPYGTLVVDEAQRLRNPESAQTQAVTSLAARANRTLLLSGTPIPNQPHDFAPLMSILTGRKITPDEFDQRYVGEEKISPGFFGWLSGEPAVTRPALVNRDDFEDQLRGHVDYFSPAQAGVEQKPEHYVTEMGPEQTRLYRAFWDQLPFLLRWKLQSNYPLSHAELRRLSSFLSGPRQVSLSPYPFMRGNADALTAYRQSPKLQLAVGKMTEALRQHPDWRGVAYSNFIDAGLTPYGAALAEQHIPYGVFHGGLSDAARKKVVDDYNAGRIRALLLGPSGGEGISLKGTRLLQILDPHWNSSRTEQAIGRGVRFDSHADLPAADRNVIVQRYASHMPRTFWQKAWRAVAGGGEDDPRRNSPGVDTYLEQMNEHKDALVGQFLDALRVVGSEKPAADAVVRPLVERLVKHAEEVEPTLLRRLGELLSGGDDGPALRVTAISLRLVRGRKQEAEAKLDGTPEGFLTALSHFLGPLPESVFERADDDEAAAESS